MYLQNAVANLVEEYLKKDLKMKTGIVELEFCLRQARFSTTVHPTHCKNQLKVNLLECILKEEQYFKNSKEQNIGTMNLVALINKYYNNDVGLIAIKEYILNTNNFTDFIDIDTKSADYKAVFLFEKSIDVTLLKRVIHLWDLVKYNQYALKDEIIEMPKEQIETYEPSEVSVR